MRYISTIYCSNCKAVGVPLIKYNKRVYKNQRTTQYHYCRDCTTTRLKKYRATDNGKKRVAQAQRRYLAIDTTKIKTRARQEVAKAVSSGELKRPKNCTRCFKPKPLQAHHEDYSKPLDVSWYCAGCHSDVERGNPHVHSRHKCTLYDIFSR